MSEENDELDGYVIVTERAKANNMPEEYYLNEISLGRIDGFEKEGVWYMKQGSRPSAAKIKAHKDSNSEASAEVRTVQVTGISIPFGDVLMLSFQGLIAGLIIVIPIAVLIIAISNS